MSGAKTPELEILSDPDALARRVANWLTEVARETRGTFRVALSGGETPRPLYRNLATSPWREAFPWSRAAWFWGDERFVSPDDPRSNYRMTRETLLDRAPVPAARIHAVPTLETSPEQAAAAYERTLQTLYGAARLDPARPLFDVNLLGLGPEGHTASLFPGTAALAERERWVVAVLGVKEEPRITLTYPVLESAHRVAFLVTGVEKRAVLRRLLRGDVALPAARVHPAGELRIFADRAAAGG